MEISAKISSQNLSKTDSMSDVQKKLQTDNSEKKSNYFEPQDEVIISKEGQELQAKNEVKILRLPEKNEDSKKVEVEVAKSDSAQKIDRNKMNQIAAKMMKGEKVSSSDEKLLKDIDPQLYARAKSKAETATNA